MENKDIRWKQRFENFEKALNSLNEITNRTETYEEVVIDAALKTLHLI